MLVCDPTLISSYKSRTVERTACESTVIHGIVSKRFLITPIERASASTSSRFHLINFHKLRVCYYCEYSVSTHILLIFCKLKNVTYHLEVFEPIYSLLNVFTRLNNETSHKDSIKNLLCCDLLFSFLLNQARAQEKQQRDTLLSDRSEIKGLGIYFAREPYRPQVINSLVYIEVINFLWISAVLPVS